MNTAPAPAVPAPAAFRAMGHEGTTPAAAAAAARRAGIAGPVPVETADGIPVLVYGAGMDAAALDAIADAI